VQLEQLHTEAHYRTTNWSSCNAALRKRCFFLIWLNKGMTWFAPREGRPGHPPMFSDAAIQFYLSIKVLFQLLLRQTSGMVASLVHVTREGADPHANKCCVSDMPRHLCREIPHHTH